MFKAVGRQKSAPFHFGAPGIARSRAIVKEGVDVMSLYAGIMDALWQEMLRARRYRYGPGSFFSALARPMAKRASLRSSPATRSSKKA